MQEFQNENESNPYPQYGEQPQEIIEPVATQALPVLPIVSDEAISISTASGEQRKQFLIQSLRALLFQQIVIQCLALGYSFKESWGFCSNLFLFLTFGVSLHIAIVTYKTRGIKKQAQVMKLQWFIWVIAFSLCISLFSVLMKIEIFGELYYLPFLVGSFLFPLITLGMIINLKTKNTNPSIKNFSFIFIVFIFFLDLIISLFNNGYIHFGYFIGEGVAYFYGLYLLHINLQIQFPVNDLSLNIEQEQTKFDQAFIVVNKGVEVFEIGQIPIDKSEITIQDIKSQLTPKIFIKYGLFLGISFLFAFFPWLYITLFIWILISAHKIDSKFIQIGKKEEIKLDEQFVSPILIYIDILGCLKYVEK